ncbi:50S ribosomal protein L10 [Candidatus Micrarchaeota archaeon]|nr:50S ribosomal protein L10 [Candidatus Micrarchaeota archaeon]
MKKADINRPNVRKKAEKVKELEAKMKKYKTAMLIDLTNLPDVLLQSSRKKLREMDTEVIVAKKAVYQRLFEKDEKFKKFLEKINSPVALLLSNKSPYEVNKFFKTNKKRMAAKAGQISPAEIIVPEGETNLPPGPALSELKSAGVNVQIKAGKIAVLKDSKILKEGDEITTPKAKALQMLGILPFEKTVEVIYGFDGQYMYVPEVLNLVEGKINSGLTSSLNQVFNFSINAKYPTSMNIDFLLTEAFVQGRNAGINGGLYSSQSIEQLLSLGVKQGLALSGLAEGGKKE